MGEASETLYPKARKEHKCWWCAGVIPVGEKHRRWVWFDPGERPLTIRVHEECGQAWDSLDRYSKDDGVTYGDFNRGCTCERGRCECKNSLVGKL